MKQEHGSLQNMMAADSKPAIPVVGMGATMVYWTDRHAFTIIEVSKSGKTIKIQRDEAMRIDKNGMSDAQQYTYSPNTEGPIYTVTLRKDGRWKVSGGDRVVLIGVRNEYYDYTF